MTVTTSSTPDADETTKKLSVYAHIHVLTHVSTHVFITGDVFVSISF